MLPVDRLTRLMDKREATQTCTRHMLRRAFLSAGLASFAALLLVTVCAPMAMGEIGGIVSELHGNVWFTEPATHMIGKVSPTGAVSRFQVPSHGEPGSLSPGPGGDRAQSAQDRPDRPT
jgi:streptogramin lyase